VGTHDSLAPGFLIASPPLGDPNFDRTVVMMAVHNADGALGFVVNRLAPLSLGELLEQADYDEGHEVEGDIWLGGPVQPQSGWVIVDDPTLPTGDGVIEVGNRIRVTSSRAAFDVIAQDAAAGRVDDRKLVMLGYSGWAPSQLEGEIARGSWLPTPLDPAILFDVPPEERWEAAYALLGLTPTHVLSMQRGGDA
jgi:putative transcriptional regulator